MLHLGNVTLSPSADEEGSVVAAGAHGAEPCDRCARVLDCSREVRARAHAPDLCDVCGHARLRGCGASAGLARCVRKEHGLWRDVTMDVS